MPSAASSHLGDKTLGRLGGAVRARRVELGLTQAEAAWRAQLDHTYLGGIERGERNPTILSIARIAKALRTTTATLLQTTDHVS